MITIPYARPWVTDADISSVTRVMRGQFLTQGPELDAFESALADGLGADHAVVVNSGTAALHLAYAALGVGPEAGIITSPLTFLATANAARMLDAPVALADVDPRTGNITPETVVAAIEKAPFPIGAIVPVHLGGRACDMPSLRAIADAHGCVVVEDACHAPLAQFDDGSGQRFKVGQCSHSHAATFSFHAIKHISMGEGGAILTNSPDVAAKTRVLRSHGIVRDSGGWASAPEPEAPWYYEMHEMGWNYRASDLLAALGRSQLKRMGVGLDRRREIAARYNGLLEGVKNVRPPCALPLEGAHAWHLYAVSIDFSLVGRSRGSVMRELASCGIGTQVHYIPLYRQPFYADVVVGDTGGAEEYYARTLSLPMYVGLEDAQVDFVVNRLKSIIS